MKLKNADELLRKQKSLESMSCFRVKKHLESFESVKSVVRRREKFIWWRVEREISSAKVGVAFSNLDDEKMLSTRFHSRVVSDHVYQQ